MSRPQRSGTRYAHALLAVWIRVVAAFVPAGRREAWRQEWLAEIEFRARRVGAGPALAGGGLDLFFRAAGAVPDAWHLRRQHWGGDMFFQDMRYAVRGLIRAPLFAIIGVLTLGLGIGANTAVFSVVNGVLLRPMQFPESNRLVMVWENNLERGWPRFPASPANFFDWDARAHAFQRLGAYARGGTTMTGRGDPVRLEEADVSAGFFEVMGVPPMLGRTFVAQEVAGAASAVAVLSHAVWRDRFGADPGIVGATVELGGESILVVGVMPPEFQFPSGVDVWRPLVFDFDIAQARGAHYLVVVGRLRPAVSHEQAVAEMRTVAAALEAEYPGFNRGWSTAVVSLMDQVVGPVRRGVLLLFGAVGLVLLIACVNVANLLSARTLSRRHEIALRAALGADRGRLAGQFLAESAVFVGAGSVLGLALAWIGVEALVVMNPANLPRLDSVRIDGAVLAFTLVVSLVTGVALGVLPSVRSNRQDLSDELRIGGNRSFGRARRALGWGLVTLEVAVAIPLVVGAGLLLKSFDRLQRVDSGFDPSGVVTMRVSPPSARYADDAAVRRFHEAIVEGLAALPGVRSVGGVTALPPDPAPVFSVSPVESGTDPASVDTNGKFRVVTAGYFEAMGIPVLRGRGFDRSDRGDTGHKVVINETLARRHFPGVDPIGEQLDIGSRDVSCPCEIIAVVGDVHQSGPMGEPGEGLYLSTDQASFRALSFVVRGSGEQAGLLAGIKSVMAAVDSDIPLSAVGTMRERLAAAVARPRFNAVAVTVLATIALILAATGIYGVLAFQVSRQTREVGVRIALGAGPGQVIRRILARAIGVTALGIALGLAASVALSRLLSGMLFGVDPVDPGTFILVPLIVLAAAGTAALLPALGAARVDPIVAMRRD